MVQGHRYFRCQQGYGTFVKKGALVSELNLGSSPSVRKHQHDLEHELAAAVRGCTLLVCLCSRRHRAASTTRTTRG